jgi:hypothetical protein
MGFSSSDTKFEAVILFLRSLSHIDLTATIEWLMKESLHVESPECWYEYPESCFVGFKVQKEKYRLSRQMHLECMPLWPSLCCLFPSWHLLAFLLCLCFMSLFCSICEDLFPASTLSPEEESTTNLSVTQSLHLSSTKLDSDSHLTLRKIWQRDDILYDMLFHFAFPTQIPLQDSCKHCKEDPSFQKSICWSMTRCFITGTGCKWSLYIMEFRRTKVGGPNTWCTELVMSWANFLEALDLSVLPSLYSLLLILMAHLTALTSITLVVLDR